MLINTGKWAWVILMGWRYLCNGLQVPATTSSAILVQTEDNKGMYYNLQW